MCQCLLNNDFKYLITIKNCKEFIYQDISGWVEKPAHFSIKLFIPTITVPKVLDISTSTPTIITNTLLGINSNLPSGIYTVEYIDCSGDIYTVKFLNLCETECKLQTFLQGINIQNASSCKGLDSDRLSEYQIMFNKLQQIKAIFECDNCNSELIIELLKDLDKQLNKKVKNGCNC